VISRYRDRLAWAVLNRNIEIETTALRIFGFTFQSFVALTGCSLS
jgi:hypothetical protein